MTAPVAGEANLPHTRIDDSADGDFTIAQLAKSKTPLPNSPSPPPSTSLLGKRRKSKPVRYGFTKTTVEKIDPPSKPKIVANDPSPKETPPTKPSKSPVESSTSIISESDTPSQTTNKTKRRKLLPPPQEIASEVLEDSRTSKQDLSTEELENFQHFHIMVKGQCIDTELPEDVLIGYYKLCMGRKELLHDDLPKGFYYKLVAGMIGETVNIANKIKNCKLTVTKEELGVWDNSLKSFENLGMKVGFIRERVEKFSKLVLESDDLKKYNEAKHEKKQIENEIKDVTEKLVGLKEKCGHLERTVGDLKEKVERNEVKFQEAVDTPW